MKNIFKISISILIIFVLLYVSIFFLSPSTVINIYRGENEKTIWVKTKLAPFKKEISGTDSYKFFDLKWSPNKKHLAFYDFTREEIFEKEWSLKIFDPRIFKTKIIFIGDYKTGEYKWIDDKTIRVYVGAGSGVRIYRDLNIDTREPFIASDHMTPEYWVPEKTF